MERTDWKMIVIRPCLGLSGIMGWWRSGTWGGDGSADLLQCHIGRDRAEVISMVAEEHLWGTEYGRDGEEPRHYNMKEAG